MSDSPPSVHLPSTSYEKSTDELRVVTRVLPPSNVFEEFMGGGEAARTVVVKVQRKWLIFDGIPSDPKRHFMGSMDGTMINRVVGRPVWRDLPSVTEAEAQPEGLTPPSQPA